MHSIYKFKDTLGEKVRSYATSYWELPKTKRIIIAGVLLGILILPFLFGGNDTVEVAGDEKQRTVTLASVGDLSSTPTILPLIGTVTSKSEATIRAESGGKIVGVYKKLGDYVSAGAVIAEFENSTERAQVLSAEGAYESASLGKDIAGISRSSSDASLQESKTQARNVLSTTYAGLDDAVRTKTDTAWKNPQTRDAKLAVTVSDERLIIELESARTAIEVLLREREARNATLSNDSDLVSELTAIEKEANIIKTYLDNLSLAFNRALPDAKASQATIDGWKASTAGARTSVGGLLTTITATRNALSNSISANQIAGKSSTSPDGSIAGSADAQVKSALGNLRAAQSRLEKTIIRSPISGTINSLAIDTGDFISPYTEVAIVSNNGALEVLAYVTEEDARKLAIGAKVTIEGSTTGVITRVAPAIDPKTKKIEVRIGITSATKLINGQSARVEVASTQKQTSSELKVPLSALKITPSGTIAFTVSEQGTLVPHSITMGALLGDNVVVTSGLTVDMRIVTDARGLEEEMVVLIK